MICSNAKLAALLRDIDGQIQRFIGFAPFHDRLKTGEAVGGREFFLCLIVEIQLVRTVGFRIFQGFRANIDSHHVSAAGLQQADGATAHIAAAHYRHMGTGNRCSHLADSTHNAGQRLQYSFLVRQIIRKLYYNIFTGVRHIVLDHAAGARQGTAPQTANPVSFLKAGNIFTDFLHISHGFMAESGAGLCHAPVIVLGHAHAHIFCFDQDLIVVDDRQSDLPDFAGFRAGGNDRFHKGSLPETYFF